ncbi:ribosomal protein S18 acetylase RimI-like enzyme [Aeromonas sp. BIGb0405]|uniref:GNAT family N-acetyltransferase n=1 Tax=Aeromonas sp. BIGb0405 TaxID=2940592 RepID=UPI0021686342|nr:GNAT family N-acetyltransferase [Aeromonas sp. BIGb0405]MCS3456211.1 ribosomal protein S18 acetylase RimI-like enzyme [Aeromonas sp. BIGb0405]
MSIRLAEAEDAAALDHFFQQLDRETRFMLFEAGERPSDIEGLRQRLEAMAAAPNQAMWLLVLDGEVEGFALMIGGGLRRNRHCALVVMGLRSSARGLGWGERLLRTLIAAAPGCGISRLELGVMAHNEAAHGLYRKCGFIDEGIRRNAYRLDDRDVDEISMGLLLPPDAP